MGIQGYFFSRHHMIGYSIESDYANAPLPSTSIYIAKPVRSGIYVKYFMYLKKKLRKSKALTKKKIQ